MTWLSVFRFLLLGPVTGACIGSMQMSAAVLIWVWHGQPDFYFRGWNTIQWDYVFWIIGGGFVGIPYGAALWAFERFCRRRIPLLVVFPLLMFVAFLSTAIHVEHHFRQQEIDMLLLAPSIAIVAGLIFSGVAARRVSAVGDITNE